MEKFFLGVGLAVLLLVGAYVVHSSVAQAEASTHSYMSVVDLPDGTPVSLYGGIIAPQGHDVEGLSLYVVEERRCTTIVKDSQTSEECTWSDVGWEQPSFSLMRPDQSIMVPIVNSGYRLSGDLRIRTDLHSYNHRLRGFALGDGVLVVGVSHQEGIVATEVYGGTLESYIRGRKIFSYILLVGSIISVIAGFVRWRIDA